MDLELSGVTAQTFSEINMNETKKENGRNKSMQALEQVVLQK